MDWNDQHGFDDFGIIDNSEALEEEEDLGEQPETAGGTRPRGRAEDVEWQHIESFENAEDFKRSEIYKDLPNFTIRNKWKALHAESEALTCRFARRTNYKKCPRMIKLEYSSIGPGVNVFDNQCEHQHDVDVNNIRGTGKKYIWTPIQEEIMLPLVKARSTAKVILRELESKGATDRNGVFPSLLQVNTKKNYMFKTVVMEELTMCDTADLRIMIEERSAVPDDPHQPFVCAYQIDDSDPGGKPRFTVTFSTRHMLSLINR
jgi:hypothetical protein